MKTLVKVFFIATSIFCSVCVSEPLVISAKLKVDYPKPLVILHNLNSMIFKYDEWYFSHEVINPKTMYQKLDLSGLEKNFIRSIFTDEELAAKWLNELAKEQATIFGVGAYDVTKMNIGLAELLAVYNVKENKGYLFIIEESISHRFTMTGSKNKFNLILKSIKER